MKPFVPELLLFVQNHRNFAAVVGFGLHSLILRLAWSGSLGALRVDFDGFAMLLVLVVGWLQLVAVGCCDCWLLMVGDDDFG